MSEKYQSREERRKQLKAEKPNHKGKNKSTKGMLVKRSLLILVALGIIGIVIGVGTFAYMIKDTPKLDADTLKAAIPSEIYGTDGQFLTEIGTQKLDYVEYEDIPKLVREAIIATEDSRFFKHHGIDPIRLGGAVIANFTDGFGSEGASTITQQLVKMNFLTAEKTLSRKAQEAWLAIQLERKYTKEEIFELYVNKVFMSQRAVGIATAADVYFGKPLSELTLPEAALIAGLPQSPNNYNPFNHPDRAEKRRNIVLSLMNQHGYISEADMKEAQTAPVTASLVPEAQREQPTDIPYDSYIGHVIKELEEKYPELNVYTDGLKIYTGLDKNAQDYVDKIMYENEIVPFPDENFQTGITLLDTKTGEIRALGGNRNKDIDFAFNYATSMTRQPGSTIKPILDYGPAIELLKWGTYQTIVDEPYKYSNGVPINNWDNKHLGPMSIREALGRSRNIPALKAMQEVGLEEAKDFANAIGIPLKDIQEAYSIGGLTHGVTTLQMAGAFSAFGNNGYYTQPHAVKEIVLRDGTKINMKPQTEVAMSDYTAFMISDMLKSAVSAGYGTGKLANVPGVPVAGKTGTTNYTSQDMKDYGITDNAAVPDSWFVGYSTNYTAAVWTGYENRKNAISTVAGRQVAQKIFKSLMQHTSKDIDTPDFTMPKSVQKVKMEKGTNKLASEYTPNDQIIYEYAVKGNAPSTVSEKFAKLASPSSVSAQYDQTANEISLTWQHAEQENVQFQVMVSQDGGPEQVLSTTSERGLKMTNPAPGATYTFKVVAIRSNQQSDAAQATVTVPQPVQEEKKQNNNNGEGNNNGNNPNKGPGENQGNQEDKDDKDDSEETGTTTPQPPAEENQTPPPSQ